MITSPVAEEFFPSQQQKLFLFQDGLFYAAKHQRNRDSEGKMNAKEILEFFLYSSGYVLK
jgi:hypothetical protein